MVRHWGGSGYNYEPQAVNGSVNYRGGLVLAVNRSTVVAGIAQYGYKYISLKLQVLFCLVQIGNQEQFVSGLSISDGFFWF